MSRLINLRSPFFVKVRSEDATIKTLRAANLDLFIWTGGLGNKPTKPTYSLAKSVLGSQPFLVFELSEYARDQVNILFDGNTRRTEPVYVSWDINKSYVETTQQDDQENGLVFGLDGYLDHQEGTQSSNNLFQSPSAFPSMDTDDVLEVSITNNRTQNENDFDFLIGGSFGFSSTVSLTNVSYQWQFRPNSSNTFNNIQGANGTVYGITNATLSDEGSYRLIVTSQDGSLIETSNVISGTSRALACNLSKDTTENDPLLIGNANGSSTVLTVSCEPAASFSGILSLDVSTTNAPWVSVGVTNTVANNVRVTTITFTSTSENTTPDVRNGRVILTIRRTDGSASLQEIIYLRQSKASVITSITPNQSTIGIAGGQIVFSVAGDSGTSYSTSVTSEDPNGWIGNSAITPIAGVVGTTVHSLSIPINSNDARTLRVTAQNDNIPANTVVSSVITQTAPLRSISIDEDIISFAATDGGEDETINVTANQSGLLEIRPSTHFRFVQNGVLSSSIDVSGDNVSREYTVRALADNDASQNVASIVALLDSSLTVIRDSCTVRQVASAASLNFTSVGGAQITSLPITTANQAEATFEVESTIPWEITVARSNNNTPISFRVNNGARVTNRVTGNGNATITMRLEDSIPLGSGTLTLNLLPNGISSSLSDTLSIAFAAPASQPPAAPTIQTLATHVVNTQQTIRATAPTGVTISHVGRVLSYSINGIVTQVNTLLTQVTTGVFTYVPTEVAEYTYIITSRDASTGLMSSRTFTVDVIETPVFARLSVTRTGTSQTGTIGGVTVDPDGVGTFSIDVGQNQLAVLTGMITWNISAPFRLEGRSSGTIAPSLALGLDITSSSYYVPRGTSAETRSGTLTFQANGVNDAVLTVTQRPGFTDGEDPADPGNGTGELECGLWRVRLGPGTLAGSVSFVNCETGDDDETAVDGSDVMSITKPVAVFAAAVGGQIGTIEIDQIS